MDDSSLSSDSETPSQRQARREKRWQEKQERIKSAKMLDLQYFLEMVDLKHRYGSNLRTSVEARLAIVRTNPSISGSYHDEWKRSNTTENFFYWLDFGEGKNVSVATCPRDQLERERVRYLSREERMNYLATVDEEGRLCWKRNGQRINTTTKWRDSIQGMVPVDDEAGLPGAVAAPAVVARASTSSQDASTSDTDGVEERGDRYVNQDLRSVKGPRKVLHVSPATILNQLLRTSVRKNTWIFVSCLAGGFIFEFLMKSHKHIYTY